MAELSTDADRRARLETLTDSIYALVIVLLVYSLPNPYDVPWEGGTPLEFLNRYSGELGVAVLGLVLIVSYWLQNNAMLSSLSHVNDRFATLAIVQMMLLLVYLFAMGLGVAFDQHEQVLAMQSGSLLLMGVVSFLAWQYATGGRRLVRADLSDADIADFRERLLPEPTTATLTLAAAPFGETAWLCAWLAFPVAGLVVSRRRKSRREADLTVQA